MNASNRSTATTPFYDAAFRYAKAFNNKLAIKVGVSYLTAKDWQATDYRDQGFSNGYNLESGTRANNPGYDGVNIYGDASANLYSIYLEMASRERGLMEHLPFWGLLLPPRFRRRGIGHYLN